MNFLKNQKALLVSAICVIILLTVAFFFGDNQSGPSQKGSQLSPTVTVGGEAENKVGVTPVQKTDATPQSPSSTKTPGDSESENVSQSQPSPSVQDSEATTALQEASDESETPQSCCTISINCFNALGKTRKNIADLPQDGVILEETTVSFTNGETVFDLLVRQLRERQIHLEFSNTPLQGGVYIEGIANLYEKDCGGFSGWMYKVNGEFPDRDCSQYEIKPNDNIQWVYTCNMGKDT